jgi:hypothetical protein
MPEGGSLTAQGCKLHCRRASLEEGILIPHGKPISTPRGQEPVHCLGFALEAHHLCRARVASRKRAAGSVMPASVSTSRPALFVSAWTPSE